MKDTLPVPDRDVYWADPGRLMAGEYPSAADEQSLSLKLGRMLDAGVQFFLDLTEEGEKGLPPYESVLLKVAQKKGLKAAYRRIPIVDFDSPDKQQIKAILDVIDAALGMYKGVYVHCFAGVGRTGTVVGCYLVRQGQTPGKALEQLVLRRRDTYSALTPSPITAEQIEAVCAWPVGG